MNIETLGRDLAQMFDEGAPPLTLDEVRERQDGRASRSGGRPSPVVAVSVFLGVVVVGLLIGLMASPWEKEPGAVPSPDPDVGTSFPTAVGDTRASCPVTGPGGEAFTPAAETPDGPPASYGAVWYGTPELWTMVDPDGQEWNGLPVAPDGTLTQKTFWWSDRFNVGDPSVPDIGVTIQKVGTQTPLEDAHDRPTTGSNPEIGGFMLVGLNIPASGCWEVSASYEGASLSYVVWVELVD